MKHLLLLAGLLCGGCASLPRDTDNWTAQIQAARTLEVGVVQEPGEAGTRGISAQEAAIVEKLAKRLGANVRWREGNLLELMHALEEREIPLVAAEVRVDSPYAQTVGMSRPYGEKDKTKRCIAVAPGQNRLLLMLDTIIADSEKADGGGK